MTNSHTRPLGNLMDAHVVHRIFGAGTASGWTACGQLIVHFASGITKHLSPLELSTTLVEPPQAEQPLVINTPQAVEPPQAEQPPLVINMPIGYIVVWPSRLFAKWFFRLSSATRAAEQ